MAEKKIGEVLPRQLFELAIQAAIGTKVVARESLSAMRKDVTAGLYGGAWYIDLTQVIVADAQATTSEK